MRVRDHIAVSSATALMLRPWLGGQVVGLWAGGVLIDADHYAWYSLRQRDLDPAAAIRFFNRAAPPQHAATHALHTPVALLSILLACLRRADLRPLAVGMALHVTLDAVHERRMGSARVAALRRDRFACRMCGTSDAEVGAHLSRQPWLLPSYRTGNLIALCAPCHEASHRQPTPQPSWWWSRWRPFGARAVRRSASRCAPAPPWPSELCSRSRSCSL